MRKRGIRSALRATVVALAAGAGTVHAQIEQARTFDVASVRLLGYDAGSAFVTDSRVDLRMRLLNVLWMAFRIEPFCCSDRLIAPNWLREVNVEIRATLPAGGTRQQVPDMLQALLIQRFGLRTHVEARPTDGYELVVSKDGIRMKEVPPANELDRLFPTDPSGRTARDSLTETVDGPVRTMAIPMGQRTITERTMYDRKATRGGFRYEAARMTMSELASIDRTKLMGIYSFSLELPVPPFIGQGFAAAGTTTAVDGTPLSEPSGTSAVKSVEQLGLKLESRRLPIDMIIVDKIERVPSDN
jgi:uncharacterized protein (TIGR03435 family)